MLCINFVALFGSCSFRYHRDIVNGEVSPDFLTIGVFLVSITIINGALHRETGALKFVIEGNNFVVGYKICEAFCTYIWLCEFGCK